jgi:tRNA(fMet)-specific endonuclease VapC
MRAANSVMLDTNVVSELIRSNTLDQRIAKISLATILVSSITEAELCYGVAKKTGAKQLERLVVAFLNTVTVVSFDTAAARSYGELRAQYESEGLSVGALDGLIAAHALSTNSTLITRDLALIRLKRWIPVERW